MKGKKGKYKFNVEEYVSPNLIYFVNMEEPILDEDCPSCELPKDSCNCEDDFTNSTLEDYGL